MATKESMAFVKRLVKEVKVHSADCSSCKKIMEDPQMLALVVLFEL